MDDRRVVWDRNNRRHIEQDHPERAISRLEVDQVLADPDRREAPTDRPNHFLVVGATAQGRVLIVVWVDDPQGRYPIHARPADRRTARRYYQA